VRRFPLEFVTESLCEPCRRPDPAMFSPRTGKDETIRLPDRPRLSPPLHDFSKPIPAAQVLPAASASRRPLPCRSSDEIARASPPVADHLRAFADPSWRRGHYPRVRARRRDGHQVEGNGCSKRLAGLPAVRSNAPAGLMHAPELKRKGEEMTGRTRSFVAWIRGHGISFACTNDLQQALAILFLWGVLQST
jgi:hypothetical protein